MTRTHARAFLALLIALSCLAPCALAEGVRTFNTRFYRVVTDTDDATANEIAHYMDRVFAEYARRLSAFEAQRDDTSTLFLFESEHAYLAFLDKVGFDASNTAGVFFSRAGETGLATFLNGQAREQMLSTLRHEGFHQFAHSRIGTDLPIWVNEGLAEYFGHGVMVGGAGGRLRVGFAPAAPLERVRMAVRNDYWYAFPEMLAMTSDEWSATVRKGGPNASLLYDQAWLMTHFLAHADGGKYAAAYERYLKLVAEGTGSLAAFERAFGAADTTAFENVWLSWIDTLEPDPISTAGERVDFLMRGVRVLDDLGVRVETLPQLIEELRLREFEVHTTSHGLERVISSLDPTVFTVPAPEGARTRPTFELHPAHPSDPGSLPTVRVVGLEIEVRGQWRTDPAGKPTVEIEYR